MPQHLIEVYDTNKNGFADLTTESHVSLGMPIDSTSEQMNAAALGAKEAVKQLLAKFGVQKELSVVFIPNAPTSEEFDAEIDAAHVREAAGEVLLSAAEIIGTER